MNTVNLIRRKKTVNRTFLLLQQLSILVIEEWYAILSGAVELKLYIADSDNILMNSMRLNRNLGVVLYNTDMSWVSPTDAQISEIVADIQRLIDAGAADSGTLLTLNVTEG